MTGTAVLSGFYCRDRNHLKSQCFGEELELFSFSQCTRPLNNAL